MIRHNFHFDQFGQRFRTSLADDLLQSLVYRRNEDAAPIFRTKHHMVLARIDDVKVAAELHQALDMLFSSIPQEARTSGASAAHPTPKVGGLRDAFGQLENRKIEMMLSRETHPYR